MPNFRDVRLRPIFVSGVLAFLIAVAYWRIFLFPQAIVPSAPVNFPLMRAVVAQTVQSRRDWGNFQLGKNGNYYSFRTCCTGRRLLDGGFFLGEPENGYSGLTLAEAKEMVFLLDRLQNSGIRSLRREGSFVFVYVNDLYVGRAAPGYLYSAEGNDPNVQGSDLVAISRPFVGVEKDWYSSNNLYMGKAVR